jgi:hypothetical protein
MLEVTPEGNERGWRAIIVRASQATTSHSLFKNIYKSFGTSHYFPARPRLIIMRSQLDDGPSCWLFRTERPVVHGWALFRLVSGG